MLGAKIKSWVEAQFSKARRRKTKPQKCDNPQPIVQSTHLIECRKTIIGLSSPESAYSTGYSTDGTTLGIVKNDPDDIVIHSRPIVELVAPQYKKTSPIANFRPAKRVAQCHKRSDSAGSKWTNATPSPRRRCRIRTNPWLNGAPSPNAVRRQNHSPRKNVIIIKKPSDLSDEEITSQFHRETAIISDTEFSSDFDTGLDGGDEDENPSNESSPSKRKIRRRPQWRRPPNSAGPTPLRMRRRNRTNSASRFPQADPFVEADREAEKKYKDLIREAEHLLMNVSRCSIEPPHNPRVMYLRESDFSPRSPAKSDKSPVTGVIRQKQQTKPQTLQNSPPRPQFYPPPPPPAIPPRRPINYYSNSTYFEERPMSEPPKRKLYGDNPERNMSLGLPDDCMFYIWRANEAVTHGVKWLFPYMNI